MLAKINPGSLFCAKRKVYVYKPFDEASCAKDVINAVKNDFEVYYAIGSGDSYERAFFIEEGNFITYLHKSKSTCFNFDIQNSDKKKLKSKKIIKEYNFVNKVKKYSIIKHAYESVDEQTSVVFYEQNVHVFEFNGTKFAIDNSTLNRMFYPAYEFDTKNKSKIQLKIKLNNYDRTIRKKLSKILLDYHNTNLDIEINVSNEMDVISDIRKNAKTIESSLMFKHKTKKIKHDFKHLEVNVIENSEDK